MYYKKAGGSYDMAKMTVYHGGYQPVKEPEIRIGRNTKDFGNGFYCTIIKNRRKGGQSGTILKLCLPMMFV